MDNKQIGQRIKETRESQSLTLQNVADAIGVAKSTIQRYEAGLIENIKLPVIESIANVLNVNPAWIIGKSENKTKDNIKPFKDYVDAYNELNSPLMVNKTERKIVYNFRKSDELDKAIVLRTLHIDENAQEEPIKKNKYIPTEEDIKSLVARNGRKLTREEAIEFISAMYSDDDEDEDNK